MNQNLRQIIESIPNRSGIYKFFNKNGVLVYVGKSSNLKNRVRSYFSKSNKVDGFHSDMVLSINNIETQETNSELEALIVEDNLIKLHRPLFNVRQKAIKCFYSIQMRQNDFSYLDIDEFFVDDSSNFENVSLFDDSISMSPFTVFMKKRSADTLIEKIAFISGLRSCKKKTPLDHCINHELNNCSGPCYDAISKDDYAIISQAVIEFFNGKFETLIEILTKKMEISSLECEFEEAMNLRDTIDALQKYHKRRSFIDQFVNKTVYIEESGRKPYSFLFVKGDLKDSYTRTLSSLELDAIRRNKYSENYSPDLPFLYQYDRGMVLHAYIARKRMWDKYQIMQ